jgi:hypothetical protein
VRRNYEAVSPRGDAVVVFRDETAIRELLDPKVELN